MILFGIASPTFFRSLIKPFKGLILSNLPILMRVLLQTKSIDSANILKRLHKTAGDRLLMPLLAAEAKYRKFGRCGNAQLDYLAVLKAPRSQSRLLRTPVSRQKTWLPTSANFEIFSMSMIWITECSVTSTQECCTFVHC